MCVHAHKHTHTLVGVYLICLLKPWVYSKVFLSVFIIPSSEKWIFCIPNIFANLISFLCGGRLPVLPLPIVLRMFFSCKGSNSNICASIIPAPVRSLCSLAFASDTSHCVAPLCGSVWRAHENTHTVASFSPLKLTLWTRVVLHGALPPP